MKKTLLAIVVLMSFFILCSSPALAQPGMLKVTKSDDGREITLRTGQSLELVLPGNITTGYSWQYNKDLDTGVLEETYHSYNSESNLIGAGGEDRRIFKAVGKGQATIVLSYQRPWESVRPADTFTLKVRVTDTPAGNCMVFAKGPCVVVNGKYLEGSCFIKNDVLMVPVRPLAVALNTTLYFDGGGITLKRQGHRVMLHNGRDIALNAPTVIVGGKAYVPLSPVARSLGVKVTWDAKGKTAIVSW